MIPKGWRKDKHLTTGKESMFYVLEAHEEETTDIEIGVARLDRAYYIVPGNIETAKTERWGPFKRLSDACALVETTIALKGIPRKWGHG